jgi:anthranilate phosphoribosyltransferase
MIALNSGAALYVAGIVNSISNGIEMAFELMKNGKAADKLSDYVKVSKSI